MSARLESETGCGADRKSYESTLTNTKLVWKVAAVSILIVAVFLRLYHLDLRPLHNDEGVNAYFFVRLFRENVYQYDPANYHGPTLYYFTLIVCSISTLFFGASGVNTFVIRLVPALFGIGTVYLILKLRDHVGTGAVLAAAALTAVSPGATYFSRDYIHESTFAFLTLGLVVAVTHWYGKSRLGSLLMVAVVFALLFATKETAVVSVVVLVLALIITVFFVPRETTVAGEESSKAILREISARFRRSSYVVWSLLGGIVIFLGLTFILFSSFLGNYPRGLHDAAGAMKFWVNVGATQQRHGFGTYIAWLAREETLLLVLGITGTVVAAVKQQRFAFFAGLWALGLLAVYSLIPYKTPWLTLNFIIPLAIVAGYAVEMIYRRLYAKSMAAAWTWVLCFVIGIATSAYSAIRLNFYHYDDERNPYVYVQTQRGFLSLVETIHEIAYRRGSGEQTSIAIMSPDYWPLPWYLRDYTRTGYYNRISDVNADIVIGSEWQALQLALKLGKNYERIGAYPLRPGVILVVFARRTPGERSGNDLSQSSCLSHRVMHPIPGFVDASGTRVFTCRHKTLHHSKIRSFRTMIPVDSST